MKKEVAEKWVKALRSGDYKQGRKQLKNNKNEYCCLGVLCELSLLGDWHFNHYGFCYPNSKVVEWAGMKTHWGSLTPFGTSLTEMNDDGKTFDEIADVIEEHWEVL